MTNTPNTAATKAGDLLSKAINLIDEAEYEGMPRDWLKRASELYEQARIITTQPSEPASAAEGATVLSDDERAELCDFCIWLGERQDDPGTRRRLGRIAQIFNVTAVPGPAQSADK
jgi:hypothetical protein